MQEPLLVSHHVVLQADSNLKGQPATTAQAWLRRGAVVVFCLGASVGLAWALPTNKNLPCPWCQFSSFIGWLYFFFWSISFWPQVWANFRRKNVEGLSFDFTVLNVLGFACYTQFNLSLFLSPLVRTEYVARFASTDIPVELNDVIFGLHALLMSLVLAVQCVVYPKHETQTVSLSTSLGMGAGASAAGLMAVYLAVAGESRPPLTWLDLCYFCSFIKMAVTLVKYIPQVALNHSRQSTEGWSIDNVLLDLSGGLLSVAQVLISCQVLNDWKAVTGNPIKFGLGLVSIGFDVIFILQHYVWFHTAGPQQQQQQQLAADLIAAHKLAQHQPQHEQHVVVHAADGEARPLLLPVSADSAHPRQQYASLQ